jgi:hypothetical protein
MVMDNNIISDTLNKVIVNQKKITIVKDKIYILWDVYECAIDEDDFVVRIFQSFCVRFWGLKPKKIRLTSVDRNLNVFYFDVTTFRDHVNLTIIINVAKSITFKYAEQTAFQNILFDVVNVGNMQIETCAQKEYGNNHIIAKNKIKIDIKENEEFFHLDTRNDIVEVYSITTQYVNSVHTINQNILSKMRNFNPNIVINEQTVAPVQQITTDIKNTDIDITKDIARKPEWLFLVIIIVIVILLFYFLLMEHDMRKTDSNV